MPPLRVRLGEALFRATAGPEGPRHRERIHGRPGPALVRPRLADRERARRRRDVCRRSPRAAAADAPPGGDDRGRRALRLPPRHARAARPHQHLPRGHDVRSRRRRPAGRRRRTPDPRAGLRHHARRHALPRHRPAPARVGARRRDRQLPARAPGLRPAPAGPGGSGRVRRADRGRSRASSASPSRRPPRPSWPSGIESYRPELAATDHAREAVRHVIRRPPLPLAVRPAYGVLVAASVGLLPRWTRRPLGLPYLPVSERTVVRLLGTAATGTIRWAMTPSRDDVPELADAR